MFHLSFITNLFRRYANPFEKEIDHFFKNISLVRSNQIKRVVVTFMQKDLVILNLWIEHKYKGYRYLSVGKRKELYANRNILVETLNQFCKENSLNDKALISALKSYRISEKEISVQREKWEYLLQILKFFQSKVVDFEYREGADFGGLFSDTRTKKLIGDCNQIVTLYVYLYSLRFPVTDLQINSFPNHVNLHFSGVDIEATNHSLVKNKTTECRRVPVSELLAINLLDVNDRKKRTFPPSPKIFLEASKTALSLSSERGIVENNIKVSFQRVVKEFVQRDDYASAVRYAKESGERSLLEYAARNGLDRALQNHNFSKAERYVDLLADAKLQKMVWHQRAIYMLSKKNVQDAEKYFKKAGNRKGIEHCYQLRFQKLQKQILPIKTLSGLRKKKSILRKMLMYAEKGKNRNMKEYVKGLLKQI